MASAHADNSGNTLMSPIRQILQDDSTPEHLFISCKMYQDTLMLININDESSRVG